MNWRFVRRDKDGNVDGGSDFDPSGMDVGARVGDKVGDWTIVEVYAEIDPPTFIAELGAYPIATSPED